MRPTRLVMTAFGPFPGTEQVDFDKFGDAPLFLINGPTGSGKTTILDAICFALYGQTTGDEREGNQMRCDLAPVDTLAEVSLSFELGGQHYRIRRVPEQQKPKTRGEGTTLHATEAQLWKLTDEGEEQLIVARKVKDATAEIEIRTGLNADQFRQVMVLPQGKFRQLLMADSRDREQIFGQLFQTQVYKKLEDSLKAQSSEIRREVDKSRQVQLGILESAGLDNPAELNEALADLLPQCDEAGKLKDLQNQQFLTANKQFHEAKALQTSFDNLAKAEAQQHTLANNKQAIDAQRSRLQQAAEAQKIKAEFDHQLRSRQALDDAQDKYSRDSQQLSKCQAAYQQADKENSSAAAKSEQLDAAKHALSTLNGYQARGEQLARSLEVFQHAEREQRSAHSGVQQADHELKTIISQRQQAEAQQQTIQQALTGLADKQLELKGLGDQLADKALLLDLQQQRSKKQQQLEQAELRGTQLRAVHLKAEKATKTLELAWHQGQAAILAQDLHDGQPCPVCGSQQHPSPAHSEQSLPTQQQLEQTRHLQQQALDKLTEAREHYASFKSDVKALQNQCDQASAKLGEALDVPFEELQCQHETLKREVAERLTQQCQSIELNSNVFELKTREEQARKQLTVVTERLSATVAQLATAKSGVLNAEQELPAAYREAGALVTAIEQARGNVVQLEQHINQAQAAYKQASAAWEAAKATEQAALQHQQQAQDRLQQATEVWQGVLQASCFATQQDYLNAGLSEADHKALQQDIMHYDAEYQRVCGALEQQQKALEGQQKPDMQALESARQHAEQIKESAEHDWRVLDKRLSSLQNTEQKLAQASAQCAALEKNYRVIGTLSDVANGQTGDKVSLQRFVLSVLLDDVLLEASQRLNIMSKGRYQLIRKEDRSKGNKASGLDLEVEDAYTGKVRPVATLSGGESFMAALAMALGLSDVVQAYAGGIRLDTLFIDEGFGSLDPESLDLAVRTLIDLQASGRMVGVISHVPDLKEQMSQRLDVIAGREGSKVRLVVG